MLFIIIQALVDEFQSEASASELSDTGGDEEKLGHKPRRRSVMAGKVISRRRFPNINGNNNNNNNQSTADEKETDIDGQGPAPTGSSPLQQPLRVPRQLPAKSTSTTNPTGRWLFHLRFSYLLTWTTNPSLFIFIVFTPMQHLLHLLR